MNTLLHSTEALVIGFLIICALLLSLAHFTGMEMGKKSAEWRARDAAIKNGAAYYEVDPKTGMSTFRYINGMQAVKEIVDVYEGRRDLKACAIHWTSGGIPVKLEPR